MENTETAVLNDFAIEELVKHGTTTKEINVNDSVVITIKSLTQEDRENYSKLIKFPRSKDPKVDDTAETLYTVMEWSKIPILVYAITKINTTDFSSMESKTALHSLLKKFPPVVIDRIYNAHLENEDSFISLLKDADIKKK